MSFDLANAWDDGFEAGAEYALAQPSPVNGSLPDPPLNPYEPKETPLATTPEMPEGYLVDASQTHLDGVRVRCVPLLGDSSGRAPAIVGTSEPGHIREVAAALLACADQQDREKAEREAYRKERQRLIEGACEILDIDYSSTPPGEQANMAMLMLSDLIDAGWRPGGAQ